MSSRRAILQPRTLVAYGLAAGELADLPVRTLYALRSVTGFSLTAWRSARPDEVTNPVKELTDHFLAGRLRTTVHTCGAAAP